MDKTISIGGKKIPRNTAIAGAVIAAVVIAAAVHRSRKAAGSSGAAAAGSYPPDGTVGNPADLYSTDPATGQTYGDEQAGAGYGGAAGTDAQGYPLGSPADLAWQNSLGGAGGYVAYPVTGTSGGPPFTDNGQWAQYVEQYFTGTLGAAPGPIADALGKYLSGEPVTPAQQSLIEQAIAFAQRPPVAGTNGMPPSINITAHHPPPPPPPPAKVKIPHVTGDAYAIAEHKLAAAGLKIHRSQPFIGVVGHTSPAEGSEVKHGSTVTVFPAGVSPPHPPRPH